MSQNVLAGLIKDSYYPQDGVYMDIFEIYIPIYIYMPIYVHISIDIHNYICTCICPNNYSDLQPDSSRRYGS